MPGPGRYAAAVVPLLPVADLQAALQFLAAHGGSELLARGEDHARVRWFAVEVLLVAGAVHGGPPAAVRVQVADLGPAWAALQGCAQGRPAATAWGTVEFTALDPSGNALTFAASDPTA